MFYPFAKPAGSTALLELSVAKKFVVRFSQGLQAQTVTILYSEIKNFLKNFILSMVLSVPTLTIIFGVFCFGFFWGGLGVLFF